MLPVFTIDLRHNIVCPVRERGREKEKEKEKERVFCTQVVSLFPPYFLFSIGLGAGRFASSV